MNKRHYEHTLPNIRGSLSNTYFLSCIVICYYFKMLTGYLNIYPVTMKENRVYICQKYE